MGNKNIPYKRYKLILEDLVPIKGAMNYMDRCEKEPEGNFKKDLAYSLKVISRQYLLMLYNISIAAGIYYSIAGLEKVFSK